MLSDMSIYFFHVRHGGVIYIDHEGVELPDLKSAWGHALNDARTLLEARRDETVTERWIEVHDLVGHLVSTPPLEATFH